MKMMEFTPPVAASIIVGDNWREDEVKLMLESIQPHVQGIYVSYNGKKGKLNRWGKWAGGVQFVYERTNWDDDFAAARNHALKMIPKDKFGAWFWIDTDDILVAPNGLDPIFRQLDQYTKGVFLRYEYAVEPETGEVVVEQWRERLLATDWSWKWKYPIHEVCSAPQNTQLGRFDDAWIRHLRQSGEERGTRERNRRIISKAMRLDPAEPRHIYYFGNEMFVEASEMEPGKKRNEICDGAIDQYRKFLQIQTQRAPVDDIYSASIRIGELLAMKGDENAAVDAYLQAVKFRPEWPDAYVGIAKSLMEINDYPRMKAFAGIAMKLPKPITTAAIEPMSSGFTPLLLKGIAHEEMGEFEDALKLYEQAIKLWNPPEHALEDKITEVKAKLAKPKKEGDDWDLRKETRGKSREKSICFFTNPIPEIWNPDTLAEGGHGGAETMIMELAPRFAADGWRTVVFGTPGPEHRGLHEGTGVEYWNADEWLPNEGFKVFVGSRAANAFAGPIDADLKLLWLHDVNLGPGLADIADRPDAILALSRWHLTHTSRLYGIDESRFEIVPNGIDMSLFPERTDWAEKPKFIYSSSPDRGLETLLGLWPGIRRRWPEASLDVFYGWNIIDRVIESTGNLWLSDMKTRIEGAIIQRGGEEGGLFWKGRVAPKELAEAMYQAEVWAYPTDFMETFCITAIQAQAAGIIPVTSRLAGLDEAVRVPWLKIDGWARNADYQSRFLSLLDKVLDPSTANLELRQQARLVGRRHAEKYSMDKVYTVWNELLTKRGIKV